MKIYDCFMYYDEDQLLDLRLNILNEYVDKFVITESKFTHSGKVKERNFDIKNFTKFKDKIKYFYIEKEPDNIFKISTQDSEDKKNEKKILNAMTRDNFQRNCLSRGLRETQDEDLIILSDIDEIPKLEKLDLKNINDNILLFEQKMFYYKFNLLYPKLLWFGSKACKKKKFLYPQWLRNIKGKKYPFWRLDTIFSKKKFRNIILVKDGGWHFTNIRKPNQLHNKMINFAHHLEYEKNNFSENDMKDFINKKIVFYDHFSDKNDDRFKSKTKLEIINNEILPEYLIKNFEKYRDWFE